MIRFLFKRVVILAVFAATVFLLCDYSLNTPVGVLTGAFVSLYRTRLTEIIISVLAQSQKRAIMKAAIINGISQFFVFLLLTVAVLIDQYLFMGMVVGLLLLPIFICLNGITEKIGLSHNDWR